MDSTSARYFDLEGKPITNGTKEKILETALDLFSLHGFSAVSIRDVTKVVGVKESTLYFHYTNKDELLRYIFENFRRKFTSIQPDPSELDRILLKMSPKDFFQRGFQNFKQSFAEPIVEKTWRILYSEMVRNPTAREILFQEIMHGSTQFTETVMSKYIALGKIKPFDPKTLAMEYLYPLFTLLTEFNMQKLLGEDTEVIEQQMMVHDEFFFEMVTVGK